MKNHIFKIIIYFTFLTLSQVALGEIKQDLPMVSLRHNGQVITINTVNLAINWQTQTNQFPVNQAGLLVQNSPQVVSQVIQKSQDRASWLLKPSQIKVEASFEKELTLSFEYSVSAAPISRNKPITLKWFNLPEETVRTLFMPFNEGMRIPTDHKTWIDYMVNTYSGSNTTQNLRMPFWSAELVANQATFLSIHLLNATNNQLDFSANSEKLDLSAEHDFTALNQHQKFSVLIALGKDKLDGARQYRAWREQEKLAHPLVRRLQNQPQIQKLIGASQVYLFGGQLLSILDVKDWWGLKDWYFSQVDLQPSKELIKELFALVKGKDWLTIYQRRLLIKGINLGLEQYIQPQHHGANDNGIEQQFDAAQKRKTWLVANAGNYLTKPTLWGQGITQGMVNTLQNAGLKRLWLGFDNWMPAFYQPEVIDQAKDAGYLIGTYDSYNTGIEKGVNDSWLTAQLPDEMRINCAIQRADGKNVKGFQGYGFYLNPACRRDYVEQRVKDILHYGRFNSLFLDVDATAMAREDYSHKLGMSEHQMLSAFNQRMDWISQQGIVLGSEDGNALTTQGLAFAHGMVTLGFGWRDPDMKQNRKSPFYLGAWYPDDRPAVFFKSAKVKEPYKTLLFSPEFKVPLYQTVFHDEVINSHHWLFDSVKFSDVRITRDLLSMLYNTPAMVHLSREDTKAKTSPRIKALKHYQDGFLPIHSLLWDKALTGFRWLDKVGLLQQTRFSDGSKIIANFSLNEDLKVDNQLIPKASIVAILSNGKQVSWQASRQ